jgi:drug/metabolite transporter (DMT)-like permease
MTAKQLGILAALAITWGCSFLFIRVIVDAGIEPIGMSGMRTTLGALTLLPFAWAGRTQFRLSRSAWFGIIGLGVLNFAIPWTIFGIAGKHIPSGAAAVANSSAPLWSALLTTILLKAEVLGPKRVLGLGLGFAGVLILMVEDLGDLRGAHAGSIALILLATFCYSLSTVSIRRWLKDVPSVPLATIQVATAATVLLPAALLSGAYTDAEWSGNAIASALALGGIGSGVAVIAYMYLVQNLGAVRASAVTYLMPPIGVLAGWMFLGEAVGWNLVAALGLILAGVALVQGVGARRVFARFPGMRPAPLPIGD